MRSENNSSEQKLRLEIERVELMMPHIVSKSLTRTLCSVGALHNKKELSKASSVADTASHHKNIFVEFIIAVPV